MMAETQAGRTKEEQMKKIPKYIYRKSMPVQDASPEVTRRKRKLQDISLQDGTRCMDMLTQVNDADESQHSTQILVQQKPEQATTSFNELTFVGKMSPEELNNHIQKCLEMSSENKITPKNAFALQLIDCMTLLLKKEDFSVMACTLDAGQKIYAHRVDGLHQQVIKLAEEVINNHKSNKKGNKEDGDEESDESVKNEKRKSRKRNVLAAPESLRRTVKKKDPKENFIKLEGLPGAIMLGVRRDPTNLSYTLENRVPFWPDRKNYKPLTPDGTVTLPHFEIYRDENKPNCKENILETPPFREEIDKPGNNSPIASLGESSDDIVMDEIDFGDTPNEIEESNDKLSVEGEANVITTAIKRLNEEVEDNDVCTLASRFETMKIIFNQASDYHYLNMDKASYWAGPEFWKRPKGTMLNPQAKKKVTRKKKDPHSISYSGPEIDEKLKIYLKKGTTLSKKTIMGWKTKNVTCPKDLKIGVGQLFGLFNISEFFEEQESPESNEAENNLMDIDMNSEKDDVFEDNIMDSSDSQDQLNSSFYESAPENYLSPNHTDHLNSAFYDAGLIKNKESITSENNKVIRVQFSGTSNSDTNLIPAPKMVSFQPIKYKSKPIRVDMQHLKQTMWGIINENNVDNSSDNLETKPAATLSGVLKELPGKLEKRTAEDLFPGMALLALLTLANENNLQLENTEDYSDVKISLENNDHK